MTFIPTRSFLRLAVAGAVAVGAPVLLAGTADAAVTPTGTWDRLAQCESTGNWAADTGNGFSGGLQFTPGTWRAFGGTGAAHHASREEQIAVAERVLAAQGWGAWPACSRKLGLHGTPARSETSSAPAPQHATAQHATAQPAPKKAAPAPAEPVPVPPDAPDYTVVKGDTLSEIAAAHGTDWPRLAMLNELADPDLLLIGQQLRMG